MPNFLETGLYQAEILRSFEFSKWPLPPSWIFEIAKFYCLLGWRLQCTSCLQTKVISVFVILQIIKT